jgi:hypothetical protein
MHDDADPYPMCSSAHCPFIKAGASLARLETIPRASPSNQAFDQGDETAKVPAGVSNC